MSIAISIRRAAARAGTRGVHALPFERTQPDVQAQLRDVRALVRHFVLAFAGAATAIYVAVASGLTI